MKFLRRKKADSVKYYEVWNEFVSQTKAAKIGLLGSAFVSFLLIILCIKLANRPVYVVRVDPNGRSFLVTDVEDGQLPTHLEARAVSESFLKNYMGFDSRHADEPLRNALSMMTNRLFEQHREIYKDNDLTEHIRSLKIKTKFAIEDNSVVASTVDGFDLEIRGRVRTMKIDQVGRTGTSIQKRFLAKVGLLRVERSPNIPSGLLVDRFEYKILTDETGKGRNG